MKIYHFVVDDSNTEIIYSSTDKSLIQECICDSFMADVWYEFNSNLDFMEPTEAAKEAWDSTLEWYNMYIYILESEMI